MGYSVLVPRIQTSLLQIDLRNQHRQRLRRQAEHAAVATLGPR